jgi:tRNA A-37 threonylcarbamoyl transferase component Bud32/membrane-associated phospholipid phosphatase
VTVARVAPTGRPQPTSEGGMDTASPAPPAAVAPLGPLTAGRPSPRRRPSGRPPPLPHPLHTTGVGWLTASVVLMVLSVLVFGGGLRRVAVPVTAVDDAVVAWIAGLDWPGVSATTEVLAAPASWTAITVLLWSLLLALLITKRLRHLLVVVVAWTLQGLIIQYVMGPSLRRPRPFGIAFRTDWYAWALPSEQMAALAVTLVGILYALVPGGRWRQAGKWAVAALLALVAIARIHLAVDAPSDVIVGVVIGVTIPLLGFRLFTPNDAFPVTYRRRRAAHLDVGGARGQAIRRALEDQLGLIVETVEPFGLAGSAGSTPLRIRVASDPDAWLFAKLYARSHLRADRWYKLGRELLYGRLEDEKPFHTVRRLVQQEDYALHKLHFAGLPTPRPYGFVELTPEREYLLVTEFISNATELGEAEIDDRVIDDGLLLIRRLWDAGLAHRDIKPANLLVRDGHMVLIDVAFVQARPSPWRQAVDLANMMLCLALRSRPQLVYERARRQFTVEEISEAFAAARGLALPSQLRKLLRERGRNLHAEFVNLLPARPRPIGIQRWSARRVGLLLLVVPAAVLIAVSFRAVFVNNDNTTTPLAIHRLSCDQMEPLWLQAQAVPSASLVPCVRALPDGWSFGAANVRNGWSKFTLDHDRVGKPALVVRLTPTCDTTGAVPTPPDRPGTQRYERTKPGQAAPPTIWHTVFPGGCVTAELRSATSGDASLVDEASSAVGLTTRDALRLALQQRSNGRLHLDPGRED